MTRKAKSDLDQMKDEIVGRFKDLGVDINFNPDQVLTGYKKGKALTLGQLRLMKDGEVVWATYKEYGENEYRINGSFHLAHKDDYWVLDDGSSFGADFTPMKGLTYKDQCEDSCCGQGVMLLWEAKRR